jgi:hypothetical protein
LQIAAKQVAINRLLAEKMIAWSVVRPGVRAKFNSKSLPHSIDDPVRINTTSRANLLANWISVDQPS